uniref:Uncharacterized protein n=1 Tax=Oryzias latipes TaxID=8090 RepID=A0A3P9KP82_ORYLA
IQILLRLCKLLLIVFLFCFYLADNDLPVGAFLLQTDNNVDKRGHLGIKIIFRLLSERPTFDWFRANSFWTEISASLEASSPPVAVSTLSEFRH